MRRLGVARALVDGTLVPGDVGVHDGRVAEVGLTPAGRGTAAPGFWDVQVNGIAGVDLLSAEAHDYRHVHDALAATGVTAWQPTFITAEAQATDAALKVLAQARTDRDVLAGPTILGAHLEGPFLSPRRAGTHPVGRLLDPDRELMRQWLGTGQVRTVTLAPELPGAMHLLSELVTAGIVVSVGHSDANAVTAHAAFDSGASAVTHVFNAMRPLHHREPGLIGVALTRSDVAVQVIADGIHVAPDVLRLICAAAGRRTVLVTDAMAAAAMPDGRFHLGEVEVAKDGLVVRNVGADGTGQLAGSALTMDAAVRTAVDTGIDLATALIAASTAPAWMLGADHRLVPGAAADLVVLDEDLSVLRTVRGSETR